MAQIRDRLGAVAALLADLPTGVKTRHPHPPSFPRPETALDRARLRVEAEREDQYVSKVERLAGEAKARWRAEQKILGGSQAEQ